MAEPEHTSLIQQQTALVEEYLELRGLAAEDKKAKRKLSRLAGKLDGLYWKRVEEIVMRRIAPDRETLDFSENERLLIDVGLLDPELVENASEGLTQELIREINEPGAPNHFYLSEWLENRYSDYRLAEEVSANTTDANADGVMKSPMGAEWRETINGLLPLFDGLPGVRKEVALQVVAGGLDHQLLRTSFTLLRTPQRKIFQYRHRLRRLRGYVFDRARARAETPDALKGFDTLNEIYAHEWQQRYREYEHDREHGEDRQNEAVDADTKRHDKAEEYLHKELLFVRSLLPLGGIAGGVTRTCAVLLEDAPRVTKKDTAAGFSVAQTCDREYTVNPLVLIAPFRGRGIFEWDRDSLVVSLVPVESAADSVANAAGNYRMLTDSLQKDGGLRSAYVEAFPDEKFQKGFQTDYRAWVNGIGYGRRDALPDEKFHFFKTHLGPDCSGVLAPSDLRNLGPHTLASVRKRLQKQLSGGRADGRMVRRLAVLGWLDDDLSEAKRLMAKAVQMEPDSGEILFSLGLILHLQKDESRAEKIFQACAAKMPHTLWAIYAQEMIEGMA